MDSNKIGVAIVGCGAMGQVHAAIASGIESLEIAAVVDPVPRAAERVAELLSNAGHPRPQQFQSLTSALTIPEVRLVVLITPSGLHVAEAAAALDAGRHVIIEKPLDVDLRRARALTDRARTAAEAGLVTSVISQHRFDTASQLVTEALSNQAFGRLSSAIASTAWWRSQDYYDAAEWRGTWQMDGGGALMNQAVHNVDLLLSFMGRPVEVFGRTALIAHDRIEVEDSAVATATFESGAIAVVHATTAAYPGLATRVHVMGSCGSAVIEDDELSYYHSSKNSESDVGLMGLQVTAGNMAPELLALAQEPDYRLGFELPAASSKDQYRLDPASHHRQYLDVVRAIVEGGVPGVSAQHAFDALALIRSVYVSTTIGRPVLFEDVSAGLYDDVDVNVQAVRPN